MSGGHFDHIQYRMEGIADEIDAMVDENDNTDKDEWGDDVGYHYPPDVIKRFKEAANTTRQAGLMIQRVDWLVSGDDGEEAFMKRWDKEVRPGFLLGELK